MSSEVAHRVPVSDAIAKDVEVVNKLIIEEADKISTADTVRLLIDYEGGGNDLIAVHEDGTIEVIDDGA